MSQEREAAIAAAIEMLDKVRMTEAEIKALYVEPFKQKIALCESILTTLLENPDPKNPEFIKLFVQWEKIRGKLPIEQLLGALSLLVPLSPMGGCMLDRDSLSEMVHRYRLDPLLPRISDALNKRNIHAVIEMAKAKNAFDSVHELLFGKTQSSVISLQDNIDEPRVLGILRDPGLQNNRFFREIYRSEFLRLLERERCLAINRALLNMGVEEEEFEDAFAGKGKREANEEIGENLEGAGAIYQEPTAKKYGTIDYAKGQFLFNEKGKAEPEVVPGLDIAKLVETGRLAVHGEKGSPLKIFTSRF